LRREGTAQPVAMVRYLATGAVGAVLDGLTGAFVAGSGIATPEPVVSDCGAGGLAAILVSFPPHVTQAIPAIRTKTAKSPVVIQPKFELARRWLTGRFGSFIVIEASVLVAVLRH
jgi:hypothetical protein